MKIALLALLTASACATAVPMGPAGDPGEDLPGAELGTDELDPGPEAPPPGPASCTAAVTALAMSDGSCAARVDVRISCPIATQTHNWARIGVLVDGERAGFIDYTYACGGSESRLFVVPCGDHAIVGGVSFDHPETAADIHCLSE